MWGDSVASLQPRHLGHSSSPDAGIGYSALHHARRRRSRLRGESRAWAIDAVQSQIASPAAAIPALPSQCLDRASVSSLPVARACPQAGCESVHLPIWALEGETAPAGVIPLLPRICHDSETDAVMRHATDGARVVAATLGELDLARQRGATIETHWSLNAVNSYSVAELADLGGSFVWLSPELSSRQIAQVAIESPVPVGVAVVGRQELMVTEHCILMAEGDCGQRCETCKRRSGWRFLRDRRYSFPIRTDPPAGPTCSIRCLSTDKRAARAVVQRRRCASSRS
jgi:putative protease